ELHVNGQTVAGLAPFDHGNTALAGRENSCYSGTPPLNPGLFHTGCEGPPSGQGEKIVGNLNTSIQAIGEGNYGRLGPGQQGRYLHALTETMLGEPATGGTPDEQPGAMPETFPSPDQGANIDRCWTCRSMFMQAWGNYGTMWAVVHQWLGVQPDLGNGMLTVVPQVPPGQSTVRGRDIRLGNGSADVLATHTGSTYSTRLDVSPSLHTAVVIGHTLPRGTTPATVMLDGQAVHDYQVRETNRGTEVTVPTSTGHHTLTITA
ncbi:MAG: glycogen debranching protein, partial [Actinobacteria bacterium]|nr:glycogen debranching protein [Actinomycetota bacterium]